MSCKHMNFHGNLQVARIEDTGRFRVEVEVKCVDCGTPFQFLGLQPGYSPNGAHVSLDGLSADLPIMPQGSVPNPFQTMMSGGGNEPRH